MKEHEREANIERRAADSSGSRDRERHKETEKEKEREKERDRYRDRHKERDREKRKRSPDSRRSSRLEERTLIAVPPMSKEARRRAFAEAAEAAEKARHKQSSFNAWPNEFQPSMFPPGMMAGPPNMMGGPPNMLTAPGMMPGPHGMMAGPPGIMMGGPPNMMMGPDFPVDWQTGNEFGPPPGYCGPMPPFCMQPNFMGMPGGSFAPGYMFPGSVPGFSGMPGQTVEQSTVGQQQTIKSDESKNVLDSNSVKLPSMWRSAVDNRGRMYYYHVKLRVPQWLPPPLPPGYSSEEDEEEEQQELSEFDVQIVKGRRPKIVEGVDGLYKVIKDSTKPNGIIPKSSLVKPKKHRPGLVTEVQISGTVNKPRPILPVPKPLTPLPSATVLFQEINYNPRTEEDKVHCKLEMKRYKERKEKIKKRKERMMLLAKQRPTKKCRVRIQQAIEDVLLTSSDDETEETSVQAVDTAQTVSEPVEGDASDEEVDEEERSRRIKDVFRSSMAKVMVHYLNAYRKPDATVGKITNTEDFKHLARKLTHFVMLKELKHCRSVDELICNDSVKQKAKEFVRKYMSKFGPVYNRPPEEMD